MVLTRDAILAATTLPTEKVAVPEWGGEVYVRTLTGTERDAFEASSMRREGRTREPMLLNFRARLAALCLCDEGGQRLFSAEDAAALGRTSAAALDRVVDVALRLNGMRGEASVEESEGNSGAIRNGASITV